VELSNLDFVVAEERWHRERYPVDRNDDESLRMGDDEYHMGNESLRIRNESLRMGDESSRKHRSRNRKVRRENVDLKAKEAGSRTTERAEDNETRTSIKHPQKKHTITVNEFHRCNKVSD